MDIMTGSKNRLWSEEQPIMQFFKDGTHLRIVAEQINGGTAEVFLSKENAEKVVQFIDRAATFEKSFIIA